MQSVDTFITMGCGINHRICEDYALFSKPNHRYQYLALSDGCSQGANTDFGARLLCFSAENYLAPWTPPGITHELAFKNSAAACQSIHMDPRCLLATLLTVIATKAVFHVGVSGDGVVAAVRHSGEIEIISHEFTKGAPYYLLYSWLGSNHKENYIKEYGSGQFVITKQVVGQEPEVIEHPLEVGMQTQSYTFSKEAYKLVAVMTDGAKSFTKKVKTSTCLTQENIPLDAIVTEMMAFKNFNGTFVDRRCKRAFETFNTNGIKNMDDFSIGVIYDSQE